jgi:anaerobic selenocysteine-containing dehydrogenase
VAHHDAHRPEPALGQHLPEPYVEIHPSDAMQADIVDGGYADSPPISASAF